MNYANEEASTPVGSVTRVAPYTWSDGSKGIEKDIGDYQVCVRWNWGPETPKDGQSYAMLQICRADGGSVFDWRHLQEIKNVVLGDEWEAVEIFPAESRLKDPSNARYLWASSRRLPFGLPGGRIVLTSEQAMAPQRPLALEKRA